MASPPTSIMPLPYPPPLSPSLIPFPIYPPPMPHLLSFFFTPAILPSLTPSISLHLLLSFPLLYLPSLPPHLSLCFTAVTFYSFPYLNQLPPPLPPLLSPSFVSILTFYNTPSSIKTRPLRRPHKLNLLDAPPISRTKRSVEGERFNIHWRFHPQVTALGWANPVEREHLLHLKKLRGLLQVISLGMMT